MSQPFKIVAPSHPFRDETCEMDGARCLCSGAESIVVGVRAVWRELNAARGRILAEELVCRRCEPVRR
jgi:hypothetical protein